MTETDKAEQATAAKTLRDLALQVLRDLDVPEDMLQGADPVNEANTIAQALAIQWVRAGIKQQGPIPFAGQRCGCLLSDKGIGRDLIERVLKDMPGITRNSIGDSLSRLKASGDYARTLLAITRQIKAEAEAARLEAERLEQEAQAAARPFPPFPPPPMGGASAAEIVQKLHIWAE